jgi:hypothetical protein
MYTLERAEEYIGYQPVQMFVTAMVGTPEIQSDFQNILRGALQTERALQGSIPEWRRSPREPFSVLRDSADMVLQDVRANRILARNPGDLGPVTNAYTNSMSGVRITLQALSGLGNVYQDFPYMTHNRSNVEKSMCGVLRMTQSIAFGDADTGTLNLRALEYGFKPTTRAEAEKHMSRAQQLGNSAGREFAFDSGSFTVSQTPEGQLLVLPSFELLKSPKDAPRCPATDTRVKGKEASAPSRPGLHTFMRAMGEVVLDEIYPYQFAIDQSK